MDQRGDWRLTDALDYDHGRGDPFAAAVRATRMPMVITNPRLPDNPIVFCNEAFQDLSGYGREEVVGRNCRFLQGPDTDPEVIGRIRAAVGHGTDIAIDVLNYRKNGSTFWNALYLSPVRDDAGEIRYFFASQLDVTTRVTGERSAIARRQEVEREIAERTADLERALEAKTLLLQELDHRVKNNLAMVGSLIRLQARVSVDRIVAARLEEMLQRVDALGSVHRRLYQTAELTSFDAGAFLHSLATELISASGLTNVTLEADIQPIEVAPRDASALGLVLNEILTNAVKHAFSADRPGVLMLRTRTEAGAAMIEIADDGPGVAAAAPKGLGRTLIERLSRQLRIQATWTDLAPGTRVSLSFPLDHTA